MQEILGKKLLTFLWYDMDRTENDASDNHSLPREHVYQAVYLTTVGDKQIYPQTLLWHDTDRTENDASNNYSLPRERVYRTVA
jgi:outer membrane receptor for Fe3+-dicitrate